jgi:hypothetical protein
MRELFIYYRIHAVQAAAARDAAQAMQERLRRRYPGLAARLLHRPVEQDEQQTWMEIYALQCDGEPAGVTPQLEADIAAEATVLAPFIVGDRHTEVFIPCAS